MTPDVPHQPTSASRIEIRSCQAADFDSVVVLLRQLWPDKPFDSVALRRVYDQALASDRQVYLCAVRGGAVVGFGSLAIKSNLWGAGLLGWVDELVVDAAHQGCGIGTQILDQLVSLARERGCNRLELDSAFHRKEAHSFYERRGFQSRAFLFTKMI